MSNDRTRAPEAAWYTSTLDGGWPIVPKVAGPETQTSPLE